jgi:hypothetical protein
MPKELDLTKAEDARIYIEHFNKNVFSGPSPITYVTTNTGRVLYFNNLTDEEAIDVANMLQPRSMSFGARNEPLYGLVYRPSGHHVGNCLALPHSLRSDMGGDERRAMWFLVSRWLRNRLFSLLLMGSGVDLMELVTESQTPEGTLKEMLAQADRFDGVVVLAIQKGDEGPLLMSSRMSMQEKAFLLAFANSWLLHWFNPEKVK